MLKTKLNDKIWNEDSTIKFEVRKNLLQIAKDFIQFVKIKNLKIIDVVFVGSLANYSYHSKSDIDLHIILDLKNFGQHEKFIDEYLQTKKALWNQEHEIELYGYKVEVYPENVSKNQKSTGMFSLIKNEWIVSPKREDLISIDKNQIKKKYQSEVDKILQIENMSKKKTFDYRKILNSIDKYKKSLRDKRSIAITESGEMSVDNLVFKMLRNNGYLEKLTTLKKELYDNALTLESMRDNIVEYSFYKGDKFILNRDLAGMHGKLNDRFKIISDQNLIENKFLYSIRNLRTRKDYLIETEILKLFASKNFLTKE